MCAASLLEALHVLFLLPLVRFLLLLLERRSCHQGKNVIKVQKTWVRLDQVPYSRSLDHSDTRSYPRDSPEDEYVLYIYILTVTGFEPAPFRT
jgi:hypothetical protein